MKVLKIENDSLIFDNGMVLTSRHDQDCCESHYLDFKDLTMEDFDSLEFNLLNEQFFNRVPDYGIELIPLLGHPVRIPGYGYNNGYYSADLNLEVSDGKGYYKTFDISDCQVIDE